MLCDEADELCNGGCATLGVYRATDDADGESPALVEIRVA